MTEGEKKMRDDCFRDMQTLIKDCQADVTRPCCKQTLGMLYESTLHQGPEGFVTDGPENKVRQ